MDTIKIEQALDFINATHQGYGNYFFKKWKKQMKHPDFPILLLYTTAYEENEFTKEFFKHLQELEVDIECGCGKQQFLSVLDENSLKLSSFKNLVTELVIDYIKEQSK